LRLNLDHCLSFAERSLLHLWAFLVGNITTVFFTTIGTSLFFFAMICYVVISITLAASDGLWNECSNFQQHTVYPII